MKKVEQITKKGSVVISEDLIFSKKEITTVLSNFFPSIKEINNHYVISNNGTDYHLLVKNISYLGHPHPIYKKRIQVPKNWSNFLKKDNSFLMGVYHFEDNLIFALFDKKQRGKNSSAHISTIDILKAVELGIFYKTDKSNNKLIVFRSDKLNDIFKSLYGNKQIKNSDEIEVFNRFTEVLDKKWDGIGSYKEMISSNFSQAFQPEWPGFYFEYKFESFMKLNTQYSNICKYIRNKKIDDLDFDVEFIKNNFFGDLKTHSVKSDSILGNDKKSFEKVIEVHGKLWYLVLELKTRKDSDFNCVVSKFWNNELNTKKGKKKDSGSYCGRMKYDVSLLQFYILEINQFNKKYILDFNQPKNSNGQPRELKIQIKKKDIDNFVIFRKELS